MWENNMENRLRYFDSSATQMPAGLGEQTAIYGESRVTPEGSSTVGLLQSNIKQVKELEDRVTKLEKNPSIVAIKINDLALDNYRLKKPIDAILKFYPNEVLAVILDLEIFGEGNNEIEAVIDLKLELIDLFDDLKDIPEGKLGKYPKSWKKIITSIIKQNENNEI
jgi:hypothetical protein